MKTQEEIEHLAQEVHCESQNQGLNADGCFNQYQGFIKGYTQCQEDLKPLIYDLWQLWLDLAEACGIQRDTHKIGLYKGRYVNFKKRFDELEKQINHGKNNT